MNIKYLIVRSDTFPYFSECRNWNVEKVKTFINTNNDFQNVYQKEYLSVYKNSKFQPHFYAVKTEKMEIFNQPQIEFKKINPTKYLVDIYKANQPFWLVFAESYNQGWRIITPGFENVNHRQINAYANGWYIDMLGNYQFEIEYWPQRYVWIGFELSGVSLVILGFIYIIKQRKYD